MLTSNFDVGYQDEMRQSMCTPRKCPSPGEQEWMPGPSVCSAWVERVTLLSDLRVILLRGMYCFKISG